MLKRSDLAKQFDLIVKQEIKNHQDVINGLLQSIRDLSLEVYELKRAREKDLAEINKNQVQLNIKLEKNDALLSDIYNKLTSHINDQKIINQRNSEKMDSIDFLRQALYTCQVKQGELESYVDNRWMNVDKYLQSLSKSTRDSFQQLESKLRFDIAKVKKEILDAPSEAGRVKRDLEEKLACHHVDVEGIMKEINVFKRECLISEKKIEQLYILIERLKKLRS